jgi:hypothetical protein
MSTLLSFEDLWNTATAAANAHNGLAHHSCCDSWTSKGAKIKRKSHKKHESWGKLLLSLDKAVEDKKQALQAKMIEEGWRLPAVLNEACQARPKQTRQPQTAFRLHQPDLPPQDFQASLAHRGLIVASQDHPGNQATSTFSHYQPCLQNQL